MVEKLKAAIEKRYIVENFVDYVESERTFCIRFNTADGMYMAEYRKLAKILHFYKQEGSVKL